MQAVWISGKLKRNLEQFFSKRALIYGFRYIPVVLISMYQHLVSPFLPPSCRFYPTCSNYARLAFKKYGILKGGWLALVRISKCNPFHPGGHDPLP
ncbi:MAG: membrane protein insertion efficiency factor YidD [Deltaproteobacteria bacterium]|nr:membrane protein insertion efficiency factor YidD [Deltaproteobacteria bacterium]MBW2110960.1 membrane protein insertion efficiency factor YidD [Deltaproteobacteria bacterium]HDZ89323.1 membrane protein insertion efficiency factor YidD [Deltaproteobacteria bacterium]